MVTSARVWTCPPIIHPGECRYRDRSRPTRKRRSMSKMTSRRYSKKLTVDDGPPEAASAIFTAEAPEFGIFLDYGLFTPRPPYLRGAFSRAVAFYVAPSRNCNSADSAILGTDRGSSKERRHGNCHGTARKRDARCTNVGVSEKYPDIRVELQGMSGNQ